MPRPIHATMYVKVDHAVQHVLALGRGCQLAKIDIEAAYRNIPVHPHDRHLLGMRWENELFTDAVLPFGLHSAPKLFNCVADALQWIAEHFGVSYLAHFLDNFLTTGTPESSDVLVN